MYVFSSLVSFYVRYVVPPFRSLCMAFGAPSVRELLFLYFFIVVRWLFLFVVSSLFM